jgi:uncharacterized protein YecT (DUF1311 family)
MDNKILDKVLNVGFARDVAVGVAGRYLFGLGLFLVIGFVQYTFFPKYITYHNSFLSDEPAFMMYAPHAKGGSKMAIACGSVHNKLVKEISYCVKEISIESSSKMEDLMTMTIINAPDQRNALVKNQAEWLKKTPELCDSKSTEYVANTTCIIDEIEKRIMEIKIYNLTRQIVFNSKIPANEVGAVVKQQKAWEDETIKACRDAKPEYKSMTPLWPELLFTQCLTEKTDKHVGEIQ